MSTGQSSPLGATVLSGGVNFSVYSRNASGVELVFFELEGDAQPARVVTFDPTVNRTSYYWHVFVPGVKSGQLYGYRVYGPFDPSSGMRFDPTKVLLDPYGRGVVVPKNFSREAACRKGENVTPAMKSVVVDPSAYDWEGDNPLHHRSSRSIIYEMHVKGFTRHPSSGVSERTRGTYAGLIEKIPYLRNLASPPSNCCRCSSSTSRMLHPDRSTTGDIRRCHSLRHIRATALVRVRSERWTSSVTW